MSLNSEVKEKQEAANEAAARKLGQLVQCVSIAASTPEGIIAFRHIMNMCSYNKNALVGNPKIGTVSGEGTIYNVGRENLWKELRQLVPIKARQKIEYEKTIFTEDE